MTSGLEMEWVYSQRKRQVREEISKEKVKKKRKWKAYVINKQTIHITPKSKIESRAPYTPEPCQNVSVVLYENRQPVVS